MERVKENIKKYKHIWILSYGLVYLLWFRLLESTVTTRTGYHIMHSWLDDKIPFCEYFIVPYLLWFLYIAVGISYFFLVNKEDYYRLCLFLFTGMTASLIICSIYPNGTDLRPALRENPNVFSAVVSWLYRTDTCTNVFPSIHVYNSIGMHIAISRSRNLERLKYGRWMKRGSFLLALSICLATVFLKQHSTLDVAGGVVLSSIVYGFIYGYPLLEPRPERQRAFLSRKNRW